MLFKCLKDIKKPKKIGTLLPETPPGICPRCQAAITIASQLLFGLWNSIFFHKTNISWSAFMFIQICKEKNKHEQNEH